MTVIANQQSYMFTTIVVIIIFWSTTIQKLSNTNLQIPRLTVCRKRKLEFVFVFLGGGRCGGGGEIE